MSDLKLEQGSIPLPPPPTFSAPGQQQYDPHNSSGAPPTSHMPPPPLPPVVIPQNNGAVPTIASPSDLAASLTTPGSAGGVIRRAAPEPNKRALYVGGLDPRVTEDILRQIFETTGHVANVKIIPDKSFGAVRCISLPHVMLHSSP